MIENDGVCTSKLSRFERMVGIIEEFRDRTGKDSSIRVSRLFVIREFLELLEVLADPVSRGLHLIPFSGDAIRSIFVSRSFSSLSAKREERRTTYWRSQVDVLWFYFFYRLKKRKRLIVSYKTIKFRFRISKWIANIRGSADYKYFNVQ